MLMSSGRSSSGQGKSIFCIPGQKSCFSLFHLINLHSACRRGGAAAPATCGGVSVCGKVAGAEVRRVEAEESRGGKDETEREPISVREGGRVAARTGYIAELQDCQSVAGWSYSKVTPSSQSQRRCTLLASSFQLSPIRAACCPHRSQSPRSLRGVTCSARGAPVMAAWFRALLTLLLLPLTLADGECGGFELISGSGLENLEYLWVKVLDSPEVDLDEECWEKCCADPNCDLAMLRGPQSECHLISCAFNGLDMCDLQEIEGARAYKRAGLGPKPAQTDFCLPKPETGRCRAYFPRWFYDAETQTCQNFTYGGCPGNLNNHLEEQSCLSKCSGVSVPVTEPDTTKPPNTLNYEESCAAPKYTGPCRAAFRRWYYDTETRSCATFTYGGCQGNKNNYQSESDCTRTCVDSMPEPGKVKAPKSAKFLEYCAVPKYTGPCRAAFQRWYYNTEIESCSTFTYGGCQGNKNNYLSESDCTQTCIDEEDNVPVHHRSATALALPILLAVLAAILLGVMIMFFVKMAKKSHRASDFRAMWNPIDDKECLMNNAYTL